MRVMAGHSQVLHVLHRTHVAFAGAGGLTASRAGAGPRRRERCCTLVRRLRCLDASHTRGVCCHVLSPVKHSGTGHHLGS